jgi:hypothetical protein
MIVKTSIRPSGTLTTQSWKSLWCKYRHNSISKIAQFDEKDSATDLAYETPVTLINTK